MATERGGSGWRRRRGVFDRPVPFRPELRYINDGGRDAPLTDRGRLIFRVVVLGMLVAFFVLVVVSVRG